MTPTRLTTGAARSWVRWYTRRLPAEAAQVRRAEIASDLWEHEHDFLAAGRGLARFQFEVIGRGLSGVPADLSWRRGIRRAQPRPEPGGFVMASRLDRLSEPVPTVLVIAGILPALSVLPMLASEAGNLDGGELAWVAGAGLLGAALLAGLFVRTRAPGTSTLLLVVGAAAPSVAWFWFPPLYLLSVLILVAALVNAPRASRSAART